METRSTQNEYMANIPEYQKRSFEYQLDCLKTEIGLIDSTISRMETITQTVKNFALITLMGSVALFLSQAPLQRYVFLSAFLPISFWFIDAWWAHLHRGAVFRLQKISEFVNDGTLSESFKQHALQQFLVLDVTGKQYRDTHEYKNFTSIWRIMRYKEIMFLYGSLIICSFLLEIWALLLL